MPLALAISQAQTFAAAPPLPDPALTAAQAAFDRARWPQAEAQVRAYLLTHADSSQALYLLAATLFHENKASDSLQTFTRAARYRPPSALDLRLVALDYVLLNDFDDADRWMTRSLQQDPADGETWYAMGRIRQTGNRFADAVSCFTKALQLLPRSVKVEDNLGLAYEGLNRPEDAIAAYRQAIAWEASDPQPSEQPYLNLGILLADRNQLDEALVLLQRAQALAPKNSADAKIHGALGKLYIRRSELAPARAELEQAVAGDPKNAGLHFQLGQVYRRLNLPERATAELHLAAALEAQGRH